MNPLSTPRSRLLLASAALLVLMALASASGVGAVTSARILVGLLLLGSLVWIAKRKGRGQPVAAPERLRIISRTGLSGRTAIALVEADGRTFLIAHGDGFAQIRPAGQLFGAELVASASEELCS